MVSETSKSEHEHISLLEEQIAAVTSQVHLLGQLVHKIGAAVPIAILKGGILEGEAGGVSRVTLKGTCDGGNTVISQINGSEDSIMYPKNAGNCGNLTIKCLDSLGRVLNDTDVTLQPNASIRRYTSGRGTFSIVFSCDGKSGDCKIEFDR